MPTSAQSQSAIDGYGAAYAARDRAAFLAVFAADAVQVDPVPAPANVGHEAIGTFFDKKGLIFFVSNIHVAIGNSI